MSTQLPISKVSDLKKIVTDQRLLFELARQGIDKDYVELFQDYAPSFVNGKKLKEQNSCAKFYRDLKSDRRFMVLSQLPNVDADGTKIESEWTFDDGTYSAKNNLFFATVKGNTVKVTTKNDQPDGKLKGSFLIFSPWMSLDGKVIPTPVPVLLETDPINPNYSRNVIEWDYGIAKRRLRIIGGRLLGMWIYEDNPGKEVRIRYNQSGDFRLNLGRFAVSDDEEVIPAKAFADPIGGYPFVVSDSLTFYPDAHVETSSVDGYVYDDSFFSSWPSKVASPGTGAAPSNVDGYGTFFRHRLPLLWDILIRTMLLLDTSSLPDNCTIIGATLSLYGYDKLDANSANPDCVIYGSNPASNTNLVAGDFDAVNSTAYSNTINYANWLIASPFWNVFTFNATGLSAISKTAISKFCTRGTHDAIPTTPNYGSSDMSVSRLNFYCADKGNGYKPTFVVTYTVPSVPSVTTQEATDINGDSATGNGTITATGNGTCDARGFVWGVASLSNPGNVAPAASGYDDYVSENGSFGVGAFTGLIDGLVPGERYYVRAFAHNSQGYAYGDEVYFDTSTELPAVTTQAVSDILITSATGNGTIVDVGSSNCIERGFVWDVVSHGDPGDMAPDESAYFDFITEGGSFEAGAFAGTLDSLLNGTTYYVRAYAKNSVGYAYGNEVNFDTIDWGIETHPASNIKYNEATGNGFINSIEDIDLIGFDWGTESGVYIGEVTEAAVLLGLFSLQMTPLNSDSTYYYRAKAHSTTAGWIYGSEDVFNTLKAAPVVATDKPSSVGFSPPTINAVGDITDTGLTTPDARGFVYGMTSNYFNPGNVAPMLSGYPDYKEEAGSFGEGSFTLQLKNLNAGKIYYLRAYAHNSYGWGYGHEIRVLVSDTVNLLYPTGDSLLEIRFDSSPGGGYPHPFGGQDPHTYLIRSKDSQWNAGGYWGYVSGNFIYEANYYNDNYYRDIFTWENPIRRTEGVIKLKWKAHTLQNDYPYGYYKRELVTHDTEYTGTPTICGISQDLSCEIFYNNPYTGVAWTLAEVDAILAGIALGGEGSFGIACCDYLEVRAIWRNALAQPDGATMYSGIFARLNGHVIEDEGEDCTVWFEYGATTAYGSETAHVAHARGDSWYADLSGLDPDIQYHYRAVILTACGETFYSADKPVDYDYGALILEQAYSVANVRQSIFAEAPTWTDITTYLMKLHIKRGRLHELDKCEAGIASFVLNNATGNFWRDNTAGAYYVAAQGDSDIRPLTLTRLRYRYEGIYYPLFYGLSESYNPGWAADEEGGMTPVMTLSCVDLFKSLAKYKLVGANPAIVSGGAIGTYSCVVDSTTKLVAGQTIQIYTGTLASPTYTQTNIIISVDPVTKTVVLFDILVHSYTGGHLKKFPSVLSGRRIMDCLLELGWPLAMSSLDYGQHYVITHTPEATGTNILAHMFDVAESEDGLVFMAANGWFVFQDQLARTKAVTIPPYLATTALSTPQATFRDTGADSLYVHPELIDDDSFIYNEADIAGPGINEQVVTDSDLQLEQGPRVLDRKNSQLFANDDAFNQAFVYLEKFSKSRLSPRSLLVKPQAAASNLYPIALGSEISTRLAFTMNSATNPAMISRQYHVEGVEHDWDQQTNLWRTKFQLWNVNKVFACMSLHDGVVSKVGDTEDSYEDVHDAPQGTAFWLRNDAAEPLLVGQHDFISFFQTYRIDRSVIEFDLSAIDPSWTINKVLLAARLSGLTTVFDKQEFDLTVVKATLVPSMPITVDTYGDLLPMLVSLGSVTIPGGGVAGVTFEPHIAFIELNATGIAYVQAAAGGTIRLALRSNRDISMTSPADNADEYVYVDSFAGGVFKPRLFVGLE